MLMTVAQNDALTKDKESTRTITLRAPLDLSRRVKLTAAMLDVTQQELWFEAMRAALSAFEQQHQLEVLDRK